MGLSENEQIEFKYLFDLLYSELVSYASYYVNDFAEAEDIVQEVFVRLWERRRELKTVQNIKGYLLLAVKNSCLDYIEHTQVMDKYKRYCLLQNIKDDNKEPEQFIADISILLDKLPEKRRIVLEMSVVECKSYAEIADVLGITLNTVKDHIKKAYAFLRKELRRDISSLTLYLLFLSKKN